MKEKGEESCFLQFNLMAFIEYITSAFFFFYIFVDQNTSQ